MNISGIGLIDMTRVVAEISGLSGTMPEPEHSDQRGLDTHKWDDAREKTGHHDSGDGFSEVFRAATGDDYEAACRFFSPEGRKARGKK